MSFAGLSAFVFSHLLVFQPSVLVADAFSKLGLTVDALDGSSIYDIIFMADAGLGAVSVHQLSPEGIQLLRSLLALAFVEVPLASFFRDGVNDLVFSSEAGFLAVSLRDDLTVLEQVRAPALISSFGATPSLLHEFLSPDRELVILKVGSSGDPFLISGVSETRGIEWVDLCSQSVGNSGSGG